MFMNEETSKKSPTDNTLSPSRISCLPDQEGLMAARGGSGVASTSEPVKVSKVKSSFREQIAELQRKIQLLEEDQKASLEGTEWMMEKNKELIEYLHQKNRKMRKKLGSLLMGDEHIMRKLFPEQRAENVSLRSKKGKAVLELMDLRLCKKVKQLNTLKYQVELRHQYLQELELQYQMKLQETVDLQATQNESTEENKVLRDLENQLEKTRYKMEEAKHITKFYHQLKAHMQEERLTFQGKLNSVEAEVIRLQQDCTTLDGIKHKAQANRNSARAQLQDLEETVYLSRKQQEKDLNDYKKQAEERKIQNERLEKKAQRDNIPIPVEELTTSDSQVSQPEEEKEEWLVQMEQAFEVVREATGIPDAQMVLKQFLTQGDVFSHLEVLKEENEELLVQLKKKKQQKQQELQDLKFKGEAQVARRNQLLADLKQQLQAEENRRNQARKRMERMMQMLMMAKASVEHLSCRLQHITIEPGPDSEVEPDPDTNDHILYQLSQIEKKIMKILHQLEGQDIGEMLKQISEEEFQNSLEGKLPPCNVRITFDKEQPQDKLFDEDSGDDQREVMTRAALKLQSQKIIEMQSKKGRAKKKE
ncbi:outer dynein arm-docking complex subunit 3 isoform X2 [Ornithorhynchus anatinus]|uniref:outer dynein arm-docking complex subunit 3 isoform X2 n=1 Tax=Ornithorhynchus anatinus TaxID=9258 RepID=UPI0010A82D89|nr:outer dynein arm-docking complex subunit 3 isoform X2 [Ornithorhynchus anatinus]